jgi:SAM-dependent methyltransferase
LELISAELWELGTSGIEETGDGLRAFFADSSTPASIQRAFPAFAPIIELAVATVGVVEAADRDPIRVGKRFVIIPADLIVLPIDAAMAFGSGRHESTQLCLTAMELYLKPGDTVFDVGCGSGILALAAQKLGATRVVGADIDETAIAVARRHFSGPLFVGSADGFPEGTADLVISNITARVNDRITGELRRIVKPGGRVVLSGFTSEELPSRCQAEYILHRGEWQCWVCNPAQLQAGLRDEGANAHAERWWL